MPRVLVVDDELAITEALADILAAEGAAVDTASNGKQALALLQKNRYDLVLLDYMMPVMNGKETLEAIRSSESLAQLRVIIMSAFSREKLQLGDLKVDGVLHKPFDVDDLLAIMQAIVPPEN